jgi:hypothetical protein
MKLDIEIGQYCKTEFTSDKCNTFRLSSSVTSPQFFTEKK